MSVGGFLLSILGTLYMLLILPYYFGRNIFILFKYVILNKKDRLIQVYWCAIWYVEYMLWYGVIQRLSDLNFLLNRKGDYRLEEVYFMILLIVFVLMTIVRYIKLRFEYDLKGLIFEDDCSVMYLFYYCTRYMLVVGFCAYIDSYHWFFNVLDYMNF